MAAKSYYNAPSAQSQPLTPEQQQQEYLLHSEVPLPDMAHGQSSGNTSPLKPLHLVTSMGNNPYQHNQNFEDFEQIKAAQKEDLILKARIRRLRVISRILAFLISVAVFVPITLTLQKFLSTQNVYHEVTRPDGSTISRTAWAKDSKVWPTWMYFLVAGISVLLNLIILFAYKFGIEHANRAAYIATTFTWVVMIGNLVVWSVAASLYRTEKDKDGQSNDLWGWTCSPAAEAIQKEFANEVDFNRFCNVQSVSWYIGLVQVGAALLTVVIYVLVLVRRKTKKNVQKKIRMSRGF